MLHETPRDLAADALLEEERHHRQVRDLLAAARARLRDARDRALLTELAYGVVRRRSTLDCVLQAFSRRPLETLARPVRTGMRLAIYQVLFLDRVPVHAAVDHAVSWVRRRTNARAAGFANAVLRTSTRIVEGLARGAEQVRRDVPREDGSAMRLTRDVFPDPREDPAGHLGARFSMPPWIVARWLEHLGEARALAALRIGITRPPLTLRARGDRGALVQRLRGAGLEAEPGVVPTAVLVRGGVEAPWLEALDRGEAWVQDASAQQVAPLLRLRPGERVLDLCAAPGGKALHVADLLDGGGVLVACDADEEKLPRLEALRARVPQGLAYEVRAVPREGPLPFEPQSFDAILLDAPCTNTGVLRRRVEARWRLAPGDVQALVALQRDLLERSLPLLRPGGRLVYATCSLEPEENEDQVRALSAAHAELVLEEELRVPLGRDQDGGYAARFRTEAASRPNLPNPT